MPQEVFCRDIVVNGLILDRLVFVDTNSIDSTSFDTLFGRADDLRRLDEMAQIVIPRTVLDELLEHKKRHFGNKMTEMKNNPLSRIAKIDRKVFSELDYDMLEKEMLEQCKIKYEVAEIQDPAEAFAAIYELASLNKPPFDKGSDKGFKDACIAMSIDDYLETHPGADKSILVSRDSRLREYYYDNTLIDCVSDVKEAIESLAFGSSAQPNASRASEVDEKQETFELADPTSASALIESLEKTGSFLETHRIVNQYKNIDFTQVGDRSGKDILKCCVRNSQVRYILADEDVHDFFCPIFERYQHKLNDSDYSLFVDSANLPNERVDSEGNVQLSRCEKMVYQNFARDLIAHIQSRNFGSIVSSDAEAIGCNLLALSPRHNIDEESVSWQEVASIFIEGGVSASSSSVNQRVLRDFLSLLKQSSQAKVSAIVGALCLRLEDVEEDFLF